MSKRALLLATRDTLRSAFALRPVDCEYMAGPEPPPNCGDVFFAVHGGRVASGDTLSLDRGFSFTVTVTVKIKSPWTWVQANVLASEKYDALEERVEEVIGLLHMNEDVRNAANRYLNTASGAARKTPVPTVIYGFAQPPAFTGAAGEPVPCDARWFGASDHALQRVGPPPPVGAHMSAEFGFARRVEPVEALRSLTTEGS